MTRPYHLGLIYPGGGPEADFYQFERMTSGKARVFLSNSEFGIVDGSDHHPDALRMTAEVPRIASAAERLKACDLDAVIWACTSGSFVNGRGFAEQQAAQLSERLGLPVSSTSLAFADAAQVMGLQQVALLSTYPQPATNLFADFLADYGIETVAKHFLGNPSGWQSAVMRYEDILEQVRKLDLVNSQALFIPDTALPSLSWIEQLEQEIGKPVLSANAVSLWQGARIGKTSLSMPDMQCSLLSANKI